MRAGYCSPVSFPAQRPLQWLSSVSVLAREERQRVFDVEVDGRGGEQEAVHAVEQATVARQELARVLDAGGALEHADGQVAHKRRHRGDHAVQGAREPPAGPAHQVGAEQRAEHRRRHAAECALECLVGRDGRDELGGAEALAHEVRADVGAHDREERPPRDHRAVREEARAQPSRPPLEGEGRRALHCESAQAHPEGGQEAEVVDAHERAGHVVEGGLGRWAREQVHSRVYSNER
mmetsp:Transcript_16646/g.42499  ORF Transcript_16646/g.42499 Transcript_16646/m.42499 type:complete len:236 (+) Transcript_16646:95-802(+)